VDSGSVEAHESLAFCCFYFFEGRAMFCKVVSKIAGRFAGDERGATMLEYGLLVGLIAIVAVTAMTALGTNLTGLFTDATSKLPG